MCVNNSFSFSKIFCLVYILNYILFIPCPIVSHRLRVEAKDKLNIYFSFYYKVPFRDKTMTDHILKSG